ncbi:MAG: hypothetical protein JW971_10940 [Synergistales bacterium]|nr:hypothetical protein [Synergistales bacterium]
MCRILLGNRQGIHQLITDLRSFPQGPTLASYLHDLELRDGGNGNGLALLKGGELIFLKKGVRYSVEDISGEILSRTDYDWLLFHTREASIGNISDENCHPYLAGGKHTLVMAMNGNETHLHGLSRILGEKTDSEFITRMIVDMDLPMPLCLSCFQSNTAGFYDGKPFLSKGDRQLMKYSKDEGLVFASDFPFGLDNLEKLPERYCWFNGEERIF